MRQLLGILALLILAATCGLTQQRNAEARGKAEMLKSARLSESLTTSNQEMFDAKYYGLDLRIDVNAKRIVGTVKVVAQVVGGAISQMDLNLIQNMVVENATVFGNSVGFSHSSDILSIVLDRAYSTGELITASITYAGTPSNGFQFDTYGGQPLIWSLSEPYSARNWWPCKDLPSDKADSADITVTVPSNLIVASNGSLLVVLDSGATKTYWWHEEYPIATYLISVAMHPYKTFSDYYKYSLTDSLEVRSYVVQGHEALAQSVNALTVNAMRIFSELFGPYPFIKEKYGHAEVTTWYGAMEHQTCSTMGRWDTITVVHELAHQWWGNMVTCRDFHNVWLNEGFASYCEALYIEHMQGKQAYRDYNLKWAYYGGGTIFVDDTTNVGRIFNGDLSYSKAQWVLHMLRHVVGDSTFFRILRTYYADARYQYGTVTTEDFRDLCERVSGKDLHQFFQQWIYGEKCPQYYYMWKAQPGSFGYDVTLRVLQTSGTSNPPCFTMPIDIRLSASGWDTSVTILNSSNDQWFNIHTSHKPDTVQLDPEYWILRKAANISTAFLRFNSDPAVLGSLPDTMTVRDTTFVMKNDGFVGDSVFAALLPGFVSPDSAFSVLPAAFWIAPGDTQKVTFRIWPRLLEPNTTYNARYQLNAQHGMFESLTQSTQKVIRFIVKPTTGMDNDQYGLPVQFTLLQSYPNPFNPSTTIRYGLPQRSNVSLTVYNPLGQQVATLVQGEQEAGYHEVRFDASGFSSGVYFYRLSAGTYVETRKLLLLR